MTISKSLFTCMSAIFTVAGVVFFIYGVYTFITPLESQYNACDMTYMYSEYTKITANAGIDQLAPDSAYVKYELVYYREGDMQSKSRYSGQPVLFIPGNAGSSRQMRSIAAEAAKLFSNHELGQYHHHHDPDRLVDGKTYYARDYGFDPHEELDVFAVHFNDELTALSGRLMWEQTAFVHDAIVTINNLYDRNDVREIILVGHSLGGMIAKGVPLIKSQFGNHTQSLAIRNIITLATPHMPIIAPDGMVMSYYMAVDKAYSHAWNGHHPYDPASDVSGPHFLTMSSQLPHADSVLLLSISTGYRDNNVAPAYQDPGYNASHCISVDVNSITGIDADHQCVVWCHQLSHRMAVALHAIVHDRKFGSAADDDDVNAMDFNRRFSMMNKIFTPTDWSSPLPDGEITMNGTGRHLIIDNGNELLTKWSNIRISTSDSLNQTRIDGQDIPWVIPRVVKGHGALRITFYHLSLLHAVRVCAHSQSSPVIISVANNGVHILSETTHFESVSGGGFISGGQYCTVVRASVANEYKRDVIVITEADDQPLSVSVRHDVMAMSGQYARYHGLRTLVTACHTFALWCIVTYYNGSVKSKCAIPVKNKDLANEKRRNAAAFRAIFDVACDIDATTMATTSCIVAVACVLASSFIELGSIMEYAFGLFLLTAIVACVNGALYTAAWLRSVIRTPVTFSRSLLIAIFIVCSVDLSLVALTTTLWLFWSCASAIATRMPVTEEYGPRDATRSVSLPRTSVVVAAVLMTLFKMPSLIVVLNSMFINHEGGALVYAVFSKDLLPFTFLLIAVCHSILDKKPFITLDLVIDENKVVLNASVISRDMSTLHYVMMAVVCSGMVFAPTPMYHIGMFACASVIGTASYLLSW